MACRGVSRGHPVSFAGDVKKSRTSTSTITRTIEEKSSLATPTLPPTRPYADPPTRFPPALHRPADPFLPPPPCRDDPRHHQHTENHRAIDWLA